MKRETENETRRGRKGDLEGIREEGEKYEKEKRTEGEKAKMEGKKYKRTRREN